MNINWLKNPNNIVYMETDDFIASFKEELDFSNFRDRVGKFQKNPKQEGEIITGGKRTAIRLFQPRLMFRERLEKDENVWVSFGTSRPCYCLNKTEPWRGRTYSFFSHRDCEFYPCHEGGDPDDFNCLFCYCPLYCLGSHCGGQFSYMGNVKDCSGCLLPHKSESYGYIKDKFSEIMASMKGPMGNEK